MAHALAAAPAPAQVAEHAQFKEVKALAFDAYGTLFDVFSVTALCEELFPGKAGKGTQLAQTWRFKQLQYSLMRSLMGRHWSACRHGIEEGGAVCRHPRRLSLGCGPGARACQ